ncbi:MAG: LysR family transcriptional regulator substrate-binding protein [Alphaproteobacteria bacterium]
MAARARGLAAGEVGYLRIGATPQTIEALLSRALARFRLTHPRVEVGLVEGANDRLLELVSSGSIHLAIAALSPMLGLDSRELFTAGLLAVLPPDDRRSGQTALEISELAGDTLLLLKRGFMTRDLFDQAVHQAGVRPRALLESGNPHSLLALAKAGHGIAIVSSTVSLRPGVDHAVSLLWQGRRIGRRVSAVWNPQRHRPAALEAFMDTLHATAQEVHPDANDLGAQPPTVGELAALVPVD